VLTVGCTAAVLFGNAHQGWMPDVVSNRYYSQVGATTNIANLGAAGLFTTIAVVLVRTLPPIHAAVLLALTVVAPTVLLFFIPLPVRRTRGAMETFRTFFQDLRHAIARPGSILALLCFLSPTACFALTNLFSALGADFHTPERRMTAISGIGVAIACSVGCLAGIWLTSRFQRRKVYLLTGFGGAAAALGLIRVPHTFVFLAVGVLTYVFFQGINYTALSSLCFEIVGPANPLASTQMAVLSAAANVPITYMTRVDGHFHTLYGLSGMLLVDAASSIVVGTVLLVVLGRFTTPRATPSGETIFGAARLGG
jgi:MFS transporter